ncbi:hypothetical protein IEQ34_011387 [Dendrobium chrysotoxum]|uniref:Uncharacterized protein n=1 Tax=Dendrobium chrysotoxum TaxID=161865 RepID=A0AAV7GS36_DENCH|nr:hypothetical protein IEQ34_011387 [Dendrobium chrysotoxum]
MVVLTHSFLQSLSGASSTVDFPTLKASSHHGFPSLWILEEFLALVEPFQFSLIGSFPDRTPPIDAIHTGENP